MQRVSRKILQHVRPICMKRPWREKLTQELSHPTFRLNQGDVSEHRVVRNVRENLLPSYQKIRTTANKGTVELGSIKGQLSSAISCLIPWSGSSTSTVRGIGAQSTSQENPAQMNPHVDGIRIHEAGGSHTLPGYSIHKCFLRGHRVRLIYTVHHICKFTY